ncbi:unnamed protein product [Closterium sp. NIES-64]|nr:unnamed protein product [Closterium sp. NIES-64]
MTVSPSEDTSPLAIASHLPRKRKSLEPATVAPAADAGQGNPATSPSGDEGDDDEGEVLAGEFDIIQMDPVELLAEHTHFCEICGKVADLKTHEKHCGRDRWLCSCGTSFSRKDKLLGHLALFKGHRPANPSLTAADDGPAGAKPTLAAAPHDAAAVSPMIFGSSFPQPEQQPGYQPEQRALADLITADLLGSAEKAARLVR